jgi:hypothetical protein
MSYRSNLLVATCVTCFGFAPMTASPAMAWGIGGMKHLALLQSDVHLKASSAAFSTETKLAQATSATNSTIDLELGDRGQQVAEVQAMLQQLGYYDEVADGVYGRGTREAVRQFQTDVGLTVDGQVDGRTWERMQQAVVESIAGGTANLPQPTENPPSPSPSTQAESDSPTSFIEQHWLAALLGLLATVALGGGLIFGLKRFTAPAEPKSRRRKSVSGSTSTTAGTADRLLDEPTSPPKVESERNGHAPASETAAEQHSEPLESAIASDVTSETPKLSETKRLPKIDIVEELIKDLNSPDPRKRRKAIWELGQRGNSKAIQPLVDLMMDSDSTQRSLILASVSEIAVRALKPMNRALLISMQDESSDVRKNAIRDLTRVYDLLTQASQLLRHAVEDSDQEVQDTARWALGQLNRLRSTSETENLPTLPNSNSSQEHLPPGDSPDQN